MNDISDIGWYAMSDERILKQIGEFVKHHRIEQNRTQATLANDAGISRSTLSLLEKGETVTLASLIRVLRILDQLQVLNSFVIIRRQSPLLLAKEEMTKRQRATSSRKKKKNTNKDIIDW